VVVCSFSATRMPREISDRPQTKGPASGGAKSREECPNRDALFLLILDCVVVAKMSHEESKCFLASPRLALHMRDEITYLLNLSSH
jgi:hypothetical protein